jgi:chromate reductase
LCGGKETAAFAVVGLGSNESSTNMDPISVLGVSGSLRRESRNTALLRAAQELAPDAMKVGITSLNGVPMYNWDEERQHGYPDSVAAFRSAIADADALLIATPEYNYSITGALKNALDWASRGGPDSPLNDKPAAIMGFGGRLGTSRSQEHLRLILRHNNLQVVTRPEVLITMADEKFDDDLTLTHDRSRDQIRRLLLELEEVVRRDRLASQ